MIDHNVKPYSYHPWSNPPSDDELDHCYTCGLRFYKTQKKVYCECGDKLHDKPKNEGG